MNWAEIFQWILKFFPRLEIINPDEVGIFLRCGKFRKLVVSGVYFCLPYFDEIDRYVSVQSNLYFPKQSIITKDKKSLVISCSVSYIPADPIKAFLQTDDVLAMMKSIISERIVTYISTHEEQSIKAHLMRNHILKNEFVSQVEDEIGITINNFFVHDLIPHKAIRLIVDSELISREED